MKSSIFLKGASIALVLGMALGSSKPAAALDFHNVSSNAVDKCQGFTPGVANTFRNRVRGVENVGTKPAVLSCVFEINDINEIIPDVEPNVGTLRLTFNNPTNAEVEVVCTMVPGRLDVFGDQIEQRAVLPAGSVNQNVEFSGATKPGETRAVGVTCNIPPNITLTHTLITYSA